MFTTYPYTENQQSMKKRIFSHSFGKSCRPSLTVINSTKSRRNSSNHPLGVAMAGLSLIVFSSSAFGQDPVNLGTAEDFAIISYAGVTNSGPSNVYGDIALYHTPSIVGFINAEPPSGVGYVHGTVFYDDNTALIAWEDAYTAYTDLDTRPNAILANNLSTTPELGGMSLAPGIYTFNTSAQLTGNLTLASGANPNPIYIFQIGSTLTTATNSSVTLSGDFAPNIYWQVGSSATLNGGTIFNGNILAYSSISLGTSAQVETGRLFALNGAVTLLGNSINGAVPVIGDSGRYWNGSAGTAWSGTSWSPTVDGLTDVELGTNADVVFSVNTSPTPSPRPINQNTILDTNVKISSLTVNDTVAVTIGGTNTLTIAAAGLVRGININEGAGLTTISSKLELGESSQIITVNNMAGLLISGVVSGSEGLGKTGTGVLTLTAAEAYTGPTIISEGTLQLGNGVTPSASIASSDSVFIGPDGILAINLVNGETFGESVIDNGQIRWIAPGTNYQASTSVFSGTGSMLVTAPTLTVLFGDNTFSGGTTINTPGEVLVGNLTSNISTPFGNGIFTLNNGTIDTVNGQLLQMNVGGYVQRGGEISMHLEGTNPGDYTRFLVDGTAYLSGGTVFVYDLTGDYVPSGGDVQNIINSTEGLEGAFDNNYPQSSFYNAQFNTHFYYHQGDTLLYPTLTYVDFNANVTWVQDSFRSVPGLTPNQEAVGGGLDDFDGEVIDFLNGQNIDDLPWMYDLIAPDELTAIFKMGFAASEIQNSNIQRHLERVRRGSSTPSEYIRSSKDSKGGMVQETVMTQESNEWSIFIEGMGGSASVDGTRNASGYDFDTMAFTIGADKRVSENLSIGVLGAYGKSDASLINGGSIDAESFKGALYATAYKDGFFVDGLLGAGYNTYDTKRSSLLGYAEGSPNGWELNAMVNTGYDFRMGNWTFTPTASVAYTRIMLNSFTETGSLTPLSYPDQHQDSLRTEIGARIAYSAVVGGMTLTPQVRVAWQHEFMDSTLSMDSRFVGGSGPTFSVNGPHMDRDRAVISAGLSAQITPTVCIYGFYDGILGSSNYSSNQFSAGVKIDF